jgi:molecular chaperone GrpE
MVVLAGDTPRVIRNLFRKKGESDVTNETTPNDTETTETEEFNRESTGPQVVEQSQGAGQDSAREADLMNKLVRLQADFDNFRKRSLAGRAEARDEARKEILLDLLPIYDNFLRAMDHAEEMEDYGSLRTGIDSILQQMREFFNRQNLREIDAQAGTEFDPNLHEAVGVVPGDADKHHTIAQEVQKGFELNGNVVRPARVLVYSGD